MIFMGGVLMKRIPIITNTWKQNINTSKTTSSHILQPKSYYKFIKVDIQNKQNRT